MLNSTKKIACLLRSVHNSLLLRSAGLTAEYTWTRFQKNRPRASINVDPLSAGNAFAPPVANRVAPLLGFSHKVHCGTEKRHVILDQKPTRNRNTRASMVFNIGIREELYETRVEIEMFKVFVRL